MTMTIPTPVTMDTLREYRDTPMSATPAETQSMAHEIIALRESMKRMSEMFIPVTGENDERAQWALRAIRGIMIENRFLAAIVYPIPDGDGGTVLRYGGAKQVVDMMIGDGK
jgi:hypothetical protein